MAEEREEQDKSKEDPFAEDDFSVQEKKGDAFSEDNVSSEEDNEEQQVMVGNVQQLVFGSDEDIAEDDIDYTLLFQQLRKEIKKQGWFTDEWEIYLEGTYLQVYKKNWHNKQLHGIHFEINVDNEAKEKNMFPIMLHAEQEVPRKAVFSDAFFVAAAPWLKKLSEYEQKTNDYTLLKKELPLNIHLLQKVLDEIDRLIVLVKPIDQALRICDPKREEEEE